MWRCARSTSPAAQTALAAPFFPSPLQLLDFLIEGAYSSMLAKGQQCAAGASPHMLSVHASRPVLAQPSPRLGPPDADAAAATAPAAGGGGATAAAVCAANGAPSVSSDPGEPDEESGECAVHGAGCQTLMAPHDHAHGREHNSRCKGDAELGEATKDHSLVSPSCVLAGRWCVCVWWW